MKILNMLIVCFATTLGSAASADVSVFCSGQSISVCEEKTAAALLEAGCDLSDSTIVCNEKEYSDGVVRISCKGENIPNCRAPRADVVGWTANSVKCWDSEKVNINSIDRGLTLTWTLGFFNSYVKHICVSN